MHISIIRSLHQQLCLHHYPSTFNITITSNIIDISLSSFSFSFFFISNVKWIQICTKQKKEKEKKKRKEICSWWTISYAARHSDHKAVSCRRVMSNMCPTRMSNAHIWCIFKNVVCWHIVFIFVWRCPCNIDNICYSEIRLIWQLKLVWP